jgi:hypothetical protein
VPESEPSLSIVWLSADQTGVLGKINGAKYHVRVTDGGDQGAGVELVAKRRSQPDRPQTGRALHILVGRCSTGWATPDDTFVAGSGSTVVGRSGIATVTMGARAGDESIEGFLVDFGPLDQDLRTAEVHVEIAYHGQAEDAGDRLDLWRSDFWTGSACPEAFGLNPGGIPGDFNPIGQPHCPVYITSVHQA